MKVAAALLMLLLTNCSTLQAFFPTLDKIEQIVATDLAAGKTDVQIEADVATLLCPSQAATLCTDAVVVLNDVLAFLIDSGTLGGQQLANAKSLQGVERAKLAARAHK
jgi:hypothetical protein